MMNSAKFFMIKCDADGTLHYATKKDLAVDFDGLVYSKCVGLETLGAAKNIYEEKYADSERIRVNVPNEILREPTVIKLTLFFTGKDRSKVRDSFNEYISSGYTKYWDSARKRQFQFYVKDELPIGEEKWNGSLPYLKCEYSLHNIMGRTDFTEENPFVINN